MTWVNSEVYPVSKCYESWCQEKQNTQGCHWFKITEKSYK